MFSEQNEEQVTKLNKIAVDDLRIGKYEKAFNYLKQALEIIKRMTIEKAKPRLLSQTFNTLGSFFKKSLNISESIKFFLKSIELEKALNDEDKGYVALSYLNLCTIFSQESDHEKSLKFGLQAIFIMKKIINQRPKLASSLVIAYYNVGNEYRKLGNLSKAESAYKYGMSFSKDLLGPGHALTLTLSEALNSISTPQKENLRKTQQQNFRSNINTGTYLPSVKNKRSISGDREYINYSQRVYTKPSPARTTATHETEINFLPQKIQKTGNFYRKKVKNYAASDDDKRSANEKSKTLNGWGRKIDLDRHRATEKAAAVIIQSWWKGVLDRERYKKLKINYELKKAEENVKRAVDDYENLKKIAEANKGKYNRRKE
ncbi:hypothetical protein SteCoe_1305 [Stentor coeruleus]|uniref:Uncharacterized protein n=1 Tax=Stentor coeruleus TaxID=5963 RepID=A0A1R2D2B6_9CILI|nr:hypothetical protein SteCoe_1305 [Stentor coeruleus]